ncbi:hypothetical protein SAMN03159306_00782 [Pseudomonas sp. NFACC48-1]|nr:hypothetical protein SAMN03159405_00726 [Pseudomonas sp. NFACC44-2]SDA86921.1 hypothetical protein SAMN03159429_05083 [Pseudomonas sp. NFACC51]SFH19364.1 hypothetical protein SAMN03159302_00724 [Pseudomonas sp. NFACC54]SFS51341.1 hypothetical protein SAMN03159306_00782 [Pseudomonas sp. NFACC48-1]
MVIAVSVPEQAIWFELQRSANARVQQVRRSHGLAHHFRHFYPNVFVHVESSVGLEGVALKSSIGIAGLDDRAPDAVCTQFGIQRLRITSHRMLAG